MDPEYGLRDSRDLKMSCLQTVRPWFNCERTSCHALGKEFPDVALDKTFLG